MPSGPWNWHLSWNTSSAVVFKDCSRLLQANWNPPGPATVNRAAQGIPATLAATGASKLIIGQCSTARALIFWSHRRVPGSISSTATSRNFNLALVRLSPFMPCSSCKEPRAPYMDGSLPTNSSGWASMSLWYTAPVSSTASRICSRQR